jgi:hypothetical protein
MNSITVFSLTGGNGFGPAMSGLRLAAISFLWFFIFLIAPSAAAAQAIGQPMAGGDSSGILPVSLGRPAGCGFTSANAINNGRYPEDLVAAGSAYCPPTGDYPYAWRAGAWSQLEPPVDAAQGGRALSVSDGLDGEPTFTYQLWNDAGSMDVYVLSPGVSPVRLELLPDMIGSNNAVLTSQGDHVVGDNQAADWSTYRAVRWTRVGGAWSDPEDLGPGQAIEANEDGSIIIGISDPWAWEGDPGPWVWNDTAEGGNTTLLEPEARVSDIAHDGSIIVGSRPQPCSDPEKCDFFSVPVYWMQEEGVWVMHDLEALDGVESRATAVAIVNGEPVIVGYGFTNQKGGILRPVVWMPVEGGGFSAPVRLEALGANFDSWSSADDINRNGVVLGSSDIEPFGGTTNVIWSLFEEFPFQINGGISDAWYSPETDGQGFFIAVAEATRTIFLAWFTYDVLRPDDPSAAVLGDPGHRWLTAQGSYADNKGVLDVTFTEGGVFDSGTPVPVRRQDGTITLEFSNCVSGTVSYDIPSAGRQGMVPIQRISQDKVADCERLAMPTP